jgi:type I restriction enzyme S subunit
MNNSSPTFKDSSLGKIPSDWEVKKIGKMTKTTAGGTPSTSVDEYWGGDIKWMSSGELNLKRVYDVEGRITESGLKNASTKIIPIKCVLIGLAGQGKTRGTVAMNMIELCTNQSIAAIFPGKDFYEDYLFYNLDFRYEELRQLSTGEGGRGGLNLNIINSLLIPLPPLPEQKAIAHVLGLMDSAINTNNNLIVQKELQKKWLMQNLLTGKKRLNGFCGEWKKLGAGEIFRSVSLKGFDNEELLSATQDRGIIPRTMLDGRVTMPTSGTESYKLVEPGDFVVSLRSFQGGLEYSYFKGIVSPAYTILKPKKKIDDEFYKQYFKSNDFIGHLAIAVIGIRDGKQISYDDFCTVRIPYPSPEEQTTIAQVLEAAGKEIQLLKTKTEKLREQKKGLEQVLLTGKKRLNILTTNNDYYE